MTTTTAMTASEGKFGTVAFVDERYELGELLGAGAMGQVFAARDVVLGIDVAVKMMHPELVRSHRQVAQFTSEATISSRMLSPNVVKVLGLAVTRDGAPCIVYERLEGETLGQRIERDGGVALAETVEIVKQTARALARAHMLGIIHRDVKPDNIFLTRDSGGRLLVKLLDFGIATMADTQGTYAHSQVAGTPEYMAPEVLFGTHELDSRADLYGLGVVTFECLTGRCPFEGDVQSVIAQLRAGASAAFTEHRPDLNGAVDAWMELALSADPYWRFASAREMSDALEKAGRPVASTTARAARITLREAA
jgi:eukaryotic-like serine/threonine-protein kinase